MSAAPRSARLSSPGEVVAILIASAAVWAVVLALVLALFFTVFIPAIQFGGKGEIPTDFPVYPGAQLQSAMASGFSGCTTVSATWTTRDDAATVVGFYKQALSSSPWTITDTQSLVRSTTFYVESTGDQHREGALTVEAPSFANGSTYISLALAKSNQRVVGSCKVVVGTIGS